MSVQEIVQAIKLNNNALKIILNMKTCIAVYKLTNTRKVIRPIENNEVGLVITYRNLFSPLRLLPTQ